ncbi:MAG: integrase core domain-containing protein [Deltaproteobacteria bacterium]
MPWKETDPMSERLGFVTALRKRKTSFRSLCCAFGVAPKTGYKWLHQFEASGPAGLQDRSRRPLSNSRAISAAVGERLVELRQAHPTWGPKKLVAWLETHERRWQVPAPSTVGELLKRRGLVSPRQRARYQRRSDPLGHADKPNAVWAMDFKGWFLLGDGTRCDPLTLTDAWSRYLLCCKAGTAVGDTVASDVWEALVGLFREYGMPWAIRVDNGQPWAAPKGNLGITKLAVKIIKVGITLERIEPGKPQQNGRHERFHLTLQQETARPPSRSMRAQQQRFDAFRREYNEQRPHEALQQRPPAALYVSSPRPFPDRIDEPEYPCWYEVLRPKSWGHITFRGCDYFISSALHRERVGLVEVEEGCFEVYFRSVLLGRIHTAHPELGLITASEVLPMSPV